VLYFSDSDKISKFIELEFLKNCKFILSYNSDPNLLKYANL